MRIQAVDSAKASLIGDRASVCTNQALKTRNAIDGLLQVPSSWVRDRNSDKETDKRIHAHTPTHIHAHTYQYHSYSHVQVLEDAKQAAARIRDHR